eukprot:scaffold144954_cov14-Prasinocladus_malaysianus.AAC.1
MASRVALLGLLWLRTPMIAVRSSTIAPTSCQHLACLSVWRSPDRRGQGSSGLWMLMVPTTASPCNASNLQNGTRKG